MEVKVSQFADDANLFCEDITSVDKALCLVNNFLGIYKTNNHYNFNLKIQELPTHLDIWSSRSLTLFGKVLIIKSLGLSQILYSASYTNVPKDTTVNS